MLRGLSGVSADAAVRVQQQLQAHRFVVGGEAWLAGGVQHITEDKCPFCSASVVGNPLVVAYEGYFSKAYIEHKDALAALSDRLTSGLGEAAGLKAVQGFELAERTASFWRAFTPLSHVASARTSQIAAALKRLFDAASARLAAKLSAPLDVIAASEDYLAAAKEWEEIHKDLIKINNSMETDNNSIKTVKQKNGQNDKLSATVALSKLKAKKSRHSVIFVNLYKTYEKLIEQKNGYVADKDSKKNGTRRL
jgi:wobble nucleotide-excising tRNase